MTGRPEISVVIAAYNHGKYIARTVESVLGQTFGDFEVIVLDDGSTDNTRDVMAGFSDGRIHYHYRKPSGLPACGRNSGMSLAQGRYISLLDGDDFWDKEKLEKSRAILDRMPEAALVCHNEAILHDEKVVRHSSYGPYREDMYKKLLFEGNCLHSSAVTIRREVFFDDGFKFSEDRALYTIEDYEYWLRLSKKYRFYFMPEVLGYYRVTDTGAFLRSEATNAVNMLTLLDREFEKFDGKDRGINSRFRKRRSAVMCAASRMYQHKNNFGESKIWYRKSIAEYPLNYKAYIGLIAALLKLNIAYK